MSSNLMTADLVQLDVAPAGDKSAVIGQLADLISKSGRADRDGLIAAFEAREAKFATGMPGGIAIPHCRADAVKEPALAMLRLATPVDFGAKDGPADLIFAIAAPDESGSAHMKLLAKLSRALVKPEFLASLRAAATPADAAALVTAVIEPAAQPPSPVADGNGQSSSAGAGPAQSAGTGELGEGSAGRSSANEPAKPVLLAITSCPTGIAHTYMAAESLEEAAKAAGVELHVETQGSGGIDPFTTADIRRAQAIIIAADVNVTGRDRFVGMPLVESGVKRAISDGPAMIAQAVAAIDDPNTPRVAGGSGAREQTTNTEGTVSVAKRLQQAVLTGVSYMIPFVAAGGLLIALGFLIGGYDVAFVAGDVAKNFSLWNLPDAQTYMQNGAELLTDRSGMALYLGAVLTAIGQAGMGFLVAALSGYIAFGLAGRPGIAPGFIGGAISVAVGAGFLGGLVTGLIAGGVAMWLAHFRPPRWLAGLMPVVIIPLLATLVTAGLMYVALGRPLASLMNAMETGLGSMTGASAVGLGALLGLMMCFDLGGPVNKAAYLFASAGLSAGTPEAYHIMAAVMAGGMVPPLAMALSTAIRPRLYSEAERENGKAAWLLGAAFISEGAIPFAAADPLRVIPSMMAGGAVTGALTMLFEVGSRAPHGGIFVIFAITPVWGYVAAIVAGTLVSAVCVTVLKARRKDRGAAAREASATVLAGATVSAGAAA
ncbi:PTS fructose transporter subunit IIABC [Rarobacter incanus]|uniref:PTS system D-fructose-specific IIA component (F1P-forming) (Frc family) /PTS system D-fructose-specific IIB component (F1P-forming) (Frc family) /PTS system D-fructose-specific IIC component (F1P-f... n=1 Tax=Rarobacter incanus TaxID=153494 RepID=A0A542SQ55_9MICO|nr:fructose-specific PTS transporter subunit EIIC [Rarobacter incanus]TQK76715.1 PTS system D-fructose-specific IIA component (F1P-forming) (Frc family) /PTS system D-fructose-specific IIB component (F1P-forming) (Frc family) /PTS system D-fructose-specific IIC component (F1P-forming) (Frc family) [Rarobacter incanus]